MQSLQTQILMECHVICVCGWKNRQASRFRTSCIVLRCARYSTLSHTLFAQACIIICCPDSLHALWLKCIEVTVLSASAWHMLLFHFRPVNMFSTPRLEEWFEAYRTALREHFPEERSIDHEVGPFCYARQPHIAAHGTSAQAEEKVHNDASRESVSL